MKFSRQLFYVTATLAMATAARAQEQPRGTIAPLPEISAPDRITPSEQNSDAALMTTHDMPEQPAMPAGVSPFQRAQSIGVDGATPPTTQAPAPMTAGGAATTGSAATPFGTYQPKPQKIPFGRGEAASMPVIPSGPHATVAVPVVDVDSLDAPEAAPPTPVAPDANPAEENPADPTELTSPIFEAEEGVLAPRKIIVRALNKVTAQSALLNMKPNEMVKFGQLEITAVTCRVSSPTSQMDYAGLLDISEKLPSKEAASSPTQPKPTIDTKPLFRGWMYASSPSITALEHPVYDVTMVKCDMMPTAEKADVKDEKKDAAKKEAKPAKKGAR